MTTKEKARQIKHLVTFWVTQFDEEEVQGNIREQRDKFVKEILNIIKD